MPQGENKMSNAFSEYLEDLKKCLEYINTNQSEEIDLENNIWELIDLVEYTEGVISIDDELESAISVAETMKGNLEKIIELLNKTANWD